MPKRKKDPLYNPPGNGEAMRRAREQKGLDDEIALLRVMLRGLVDDKTKNGDKDTNNDEQKEQKPVDEGLVLSIINTLGRALMAQARVGGVDPGAAARGAQSVLRRLGVILTEDGSKGTGKRGPVSEGRDLG